MSLLQEWRDWRDARKRKRLADYIATLEGLTIDLQNGRITAEAAFGGPPIKLFAASMVAWFRETGGKNYVTVDMTDTRTGERYEITMQRATGSTPAQKLAELNAEVEALRGQLNTVSCGFGDAR